jgi:hypothetical protein
VRGGAARLEELGVALERVGQVGTEGRVAFLIGDQVTLGEWPELREAWRVTQPKALDPAALEWIAFEHELEQLRQALILIDPAPLHLNPRAIGHQHLLLARFR